MESLPPSTHINDVYTWGGGTKFKLGYHDSGRKPQCLKQFQGIGPTFLSIGENHSAVIIDHGKDVYAWGSGERGQLGRGDTESQNTPRLVIFLRDKQIHYISCGFDHTLALSSSGIVYTFGNNNKGQLGIGGQVSFVPAPEIIKGPWIKSESNGIESPLIVQVTAGNAVSAAVSRSGHVYIWGNATDGLLANLDKVNHAWIPIPIPNCPQGKIVSIQFGGTHALLLTDDGEVFSWGSNKFGQLGIGNDKKNHVDTPTQIIVPFQGRIISEISAGNFHSFCLTSNGDLYGFGNGSYGQLGLGDRLNQFIPKKIEFPLSIKGDVIKHVSCGSSHSLALTEKGRVYGWGAGTKYQLGLPDRKDCLNPKWVDTLHPLLLQQISCGGDSSGALTGRKVAHDSQIKVNPRLSMIETEAASVWIGSYNINAQRQTLSLRSLTTWLLSLSEIPDIYVLGFQEIVNLSGKEVAKDLAEIQGRMKAFAECQIEAALNTNPFGVKYTQVFSKQLVGVMLCVYVKKEIESFITDVEWDEIRVGVMNKMGNKGAIAVRFNYCETQFCFVNSHLAAGQAKAEKRNQDHKTILTKIRFPSSGQRELSIMDHENIFWFGDFNYRINQLTKDEIEHHIQQQTWDELFMFDQLRTEQAAERCFMGFKEGKINFAPTYKYEPFTTTYYSGERIRTPAWCDRILFRGESIKQKEYRRHELLSSDHRPISALFEVGIKRVVDSNLSQNVTSTVTFNRYPSNNQSESTRNKKLDQPLAWAMVTHEYKAENEKELAISKDDILGIVQMDDSGWWKAFKRTEANVIGWIPNTFISIILSPETLKQYEEDWKHIQKALDIHSEPHDEEVDTRKKKEDSTSHLLKCPSDDEIGLKTQNHLAFLRSSQTDTVIDQFASNVVKEGYLRKKGHIRKNWLTRFFVLTTKNMSYFPSKMLSTPKDLLGEIDLSDANRIRVTKGNGYDKKLFLKVPSKEFEIEAPTSQDRDAWIRAIQLVLELNGGGVVNFK